MNEQLMLTKMFPHLIANYSFTSYEGFINAEGVYFQISLQVPNYPSLFKMTLQCSWMASHLLTRHSLLLKEWMKNGTLSLFLENLKTLLISERKKSAFHPSLVEESMTPQSFRILISDLNLVGFSNVISLSSNLSEMKLKMIDESNREHTIDVNVGKTYPHDPIKIQTMLPDCAVEIISKNTCVDGIYKSFVQQIVLLQNVWNALDLIDCYCCVLDPEHPTRKDMGRRIMIEKNVSIFLKMNVEDSTATPDITVLGPENIAQHYQSTLTRNMKLWKSCNSIVDNLRLVLEVKSLPVKSLGNDELSLVQQGNCSICYTLRLDGELPSEVCEDPLCACAFHSACLFEWLQTVVGNYQSLNKIHGICPNCGVGISCFVPNYT